MNILILHQNFPGQFPYIARHLSRMGHHVISVGSKTAQGLRGIPFIKYAIKGRVSQPHKFLVTVTEAVHRGNAVLEALRSMKNRGERPDVVLAHPGWGEALYVKDVFPNTRLVSFFEFYYHMHGADLGFDTESELDPNDGPRMRTRNMLHLMNLDICDAGVSPTNWQKSLHPSRYHDKISVVHEGVDSGHMAPDQAATLTLPDGRVLRHGDPVITFVSRTLEAYRGFHVFMRALPEIQRRNPEALTVLVGGEGPGYGRAPKGARSWREKMLAEVGPQLDLSRVVFTGKLPYAQYRRLLQISAAHVYLTYPFVLSWSMLEAMSCGCLVIGSSTPPVAEVVTHGRNGLLFDFFDIEQLAKTVTVALRKPDMLRPLRQSARALIQERYDVAQGVRGYVKLLEG